MSWLVLALIMASGIGAWASQDDDSPLSQQILVSVQNYRRSTREMQQLQQTLQQQAGVKDVMDFPSMQELIRDSVTPAYAQLKDLFGRYRDENGPKDLQKFAERHQFADLLPN